METWRGLTRPKWRGSPRPSLGRPPPTSARYERPLGLPAFAVVAIGSGGSLTAAHALAAFLRGTHQVTAVATPLDAMTEPLDGGVAIWLLSAGGGNVDILAATKHL